MCEVVDNLWITFLYPIKDQPRSTLSGLWITYCDQITAKVMFEKVIHSYQHSYPQSYPQFHSVIHGELCFIGNFYTDFLI